MRPTHSGRRFVANRAFTDREAPRATFERALQAPQAADDYRVLCWYGVGGQGKSALFREFQRMLAAVREERPKHSDDPPLGVALLDFERTRYHDLEQALISIRLQLSKSARIKFPAFDTAFARYFALDNPGANLQSHHPELFQTESEILDDLLKFGDAASELIPGANVLYKYGTRAGIKLRTWWEHRGKRVLADLDDYRADQLLEMLPSYLGADICDALGGETPPRLVIMMDTYEALWREQSQKEGPGALRVDDWVRLLVQDSPGALFVILGRDKLRWAELDDDWETVLEQHLLGALSNADAEAFLRQVPIEDARIRRRIVSGARGLPFYLDLQVDLYEDRASGDAAALRPEQFGGSHPTILARFLDHLGERGEALLRLASYPGVIREDVLNHLAERFLGGAAQANIGRLLARSFISQLEDGGASMHALMRDELQRREKKQRPMLFRQIHQALFAWHDARCQPRGPQEVDAAHEASLLEAARHLEAADPRALPDWAFSRQEPFFQAARWRSLQALLQRAADTAESMLGPEHPDRATALHNLAQVYQETGHYGDAETLLEQARRIYEKTLGAAHPDCAATLQNLAQVYQETGRYGEAEALYNKVRRLQEDGLDRDDPRRAATLHNLALLYQRTGRYGAAERLYGETRLIEEKLLGESHPDTLATLHNLAQVYLETGRYGEAEALYEQVRGIQERVLGPNHPDYAATLGSLAWVYQETGRYGEAEILYDAVRAIYEQALGREHPHYAAALDGLAWVYQVTGRYTETERLYEEALAIQAAALGSDHPHYAASLNGLAWVRQVTARYDEAEALYEEVRRIYEQALGREHPDYAAALNGLARVYQETGRYTEAEALYEEVRAVEEKTRGRAHSHFAATLGGLATVYLETGRHAEAEALFEQVRAIQVQALGPSHPLYAATLNGLARVYLETGRHAEAATASDEALAICHAGLPAGHPLLGRVLGRRAAIHAAMRRTEEARQDFHAAIANLEPKLGREHPWSRQMRDALARLEAGE